MSWLPPPPQKLGGLREHPPAPRPDPVLDMLAASEENVDDREWQGGSSGAMLPVPPPQPQAPPEPVGLPPPPWVDEVAASPTVPLDPPKPEMDALSEMKRTDEGDFDPPGPEQPVTTKPLERFTPPPADWAAEQAERVEAGDDELQPIIPHPPWSPSAKGSP